MASNLPALGGHISIARRFDVTLGAVLPGLSGGMSAAYLSGAQRPTAAQVHAHGQMAQPLECGIAQPEHHASRTNTGFESVFAKASASSTFLHAPYSDARRTPASSASPFADAARCFAPGVLASMADAIHRPQRAKSLFEDGVSARAGLGARFQDGLTDRRAKVQALFQEARRRTALRYRGSAGAAMAVASSRRSHFQEAWVARPGIAPVPTVPVVVPPYWGAHLLFACPPLAAPNLVFGVTQCGASGTPEAFFYILPARFYMTAHTIYAQRLPDLADVPIFDATVSADSGSYCWTLSATGPQSLFAQLAPVDGLPVQLRLTLDGIPWVFAVDAIGRTSAFGKTGVSISGRSVTALIGAPYLRATTRSNTEPRLAQQLALEALQYSGVDLDWGLTDWLVPTAAWSHQGTPLDAVQAIAQAAGGYLQSHRSAAALLTRHPYSQRTGDNPGAPWGWMTGPADVELAPDAIITEGVDRRDGPDINAVYVSGTTQGVLAQVKRTGSAGDKLGAMVTDALITDAAAARQRGLAILGTAGPQYNVRMDLPVLTGVGQPGVLDVGQLVQINTTVPWRGRVRAVSVAAKSPSLRQSITLERHL
jgi:hypothetical protein